MEAARYSEKSMSKHEPARNQAETERYPSLKAKTYLRGSSLLLNSCFWSGDKSS